MKAGQTAGAVASPVLGVIWGSPASTSPLAGFVSEHKRNEPCNHFKAPLGARFCGIVLGALGFIKGKLPAAGSPGSLIATAHFPLALPVETVQRAAGVQLRGVLLPCWRQVPCGYWGAGAASTSAPGPRCSHPSAPAGVVQTPITPFLELPIYSSYILSKISSLSPAVKSKVTCRTKCFYSRKTEVSSRTIETASDANQLMFHKVYHSTSLLNEPVSVRVPFPSPTKFESTFFSLTHRPRFLLTHFNNFC